MFSGFWLSALASLGIGLPVLALLPAPLCAPCPDRSRVAPTASEGSLPARAAVVPRAKSKALVSPVLKVPLPFNWLKAVCKVSMAELERLEPAILSTDRVLAALPLMVLFKRDEVAACVEKLILASRVLTPACSSRSFMSEMAVLAVLGLVGLMGLMGLGLVGLVTKGEPALDWSKLFNPLAPMPALSGLLKATGVLPKAPIA